jgi:hypothetical protein
VPEFRERTRRRCAICFGIDRDYSVKSGQIAHLDHNSGNNAIDNLAFLCLNHHDQYDSSTRQSKGLTIGEVKVFRAELAEALLAAREAPISLTPESAPRATWQGVYRWENENASAELSIERIDTDRYAVRGLAFWGTLRPSGPNTGEIDAEARGQADLLVVESSGYTLVLKLTADGVMATEEGNRASLGHNVSFAGTFRKIPRGAEVFRQPSLRLFESEFWPEEGRPKFVVKTSPLLLHARPSSESPIVGELPLSLGAPIDFHGFRYRTLRPGEVVAVTDCVVHGRVLGATDYISNANYYHDGGESASIQLARGDRLEYLQYRAEGTGFVRWQGLVFDTDVTWSDLQSPLKQTREPIAEGWVRIGESASDTPGWVLVDEQLQEIDRDF